MADFSWTEAQRSIIQEAIDAEIENSRLAHKLIPEYRLTPNDRAVARDRFNYADGKIDETYVDLEEPGQPFFLTKLQTEDDDVGLARMRVRRAAQELARKHGVEVFRTRLRDVINAKAGNEGFHPVVPINQPYSDGLAPAVAAAVAKLDGKGYRTSFVMVAGHDVYKHLHEREPGAADLPIEAVKGLLEDGPVHRSAVLPPDEALILSISGEELDRAVAVDPMLEFQRIGDKENREFRLFERFRIRFKQTYSAVLLRFAAAPLGVAAAAAAEAVARADEAEAARAAAEDRVAATEAAMVAAAEAAKAAGAQAEAAAAAAAEAANKAQAAAAAEVAAGDKAKDPKK